MWYSAVTVPSWSAPVAKIDPKVKALLDAIEGEGKQTATLDAKALEGLHKHLQANPEARPKSARRVWDSKQPGLFLRVMPGPGGAMSFNVQWSRKSSISLGKFPTTTLGAARDRAAVTMGEVSKDPDAVPTEVARKQTGDDLTLARFVEDHYRPHARRHMTHGDRDADRIMRVLAKFKSKQLDSITHGALQRALNARDVAPSTLARDRNTIRAAFNLAVEWDLLESNPAIGLKVGKAAEGVTRYLSADEERALLDTLAARDQGMRDARLRTIRGGRQQHAALREIPADHFPDHLTPLVLTALHTGCRRGELFKLRWADVDLEGKHPQLTVQGGTAKSGRTRYIPLNGTAVQTLAQWRRQNPGADRVFGLVDIKKSWAKLLTDAGIENFRFHDLRHTFASKLVQRGVPLNTVRDLLGHADIKMTLRYAHLAPENKAAAVSLLDGPIEAEASNVVQFPARAG